MSVMGEGRQSLQILIILMLLETNLYPTEISRSLIFYSQYIRFNKLDLFKGTYCTWTCCISIEFIK